jgi:hypothetical protein
MATYEIIHPNASATTYNIGDGTYCQLQYPNGFSGVGLPPITRDLQRHPNIEGAIDHGFTLEPRDLMLNLYYNVNSAAAADARRDAIYKIFRPFDDPLKLKVTRDDGAVRQIDVHTVGMLDLPTSERVGFDQGFNVRLLAPNPIWYDPSSITLNITPLGTPWLSNLSYTGTWDEYPIINVYGEAQDFSMYSVITTATDTTTYSTGSFDIPAGDIFTFDLRPGYKTIKNAAGVSQLGSGTAQNTFNFLFGFRLFADPIEASGTNQLIGNYTTKDGTHKIQFVYYRRYLGV